MNIKYKDSDLIGKKFGRLTILSIFRKKKILETQQDIVNVSVIVEMK